MNVVLLHDWLTTYRGGERVFEVFCEMFPNAPIYTLIHEPGSTSKIIEKHEIIASPLNKIPRATKHYRKLLPMFPWAAEQLKIPNNTDLIISSSHCVIKGVKKQNPCKHLSYIHSPMRYIYDQFETYFGKDAPLHHRVGAKVFRSYLQKWDLNSNKNVDVMVANSKFVQSRIQTYYKRPSKVIHPFVDLKDFAYKQLNPPPKEDFFLILSAFAPNKKIDVAIKAFNKLKFPLKIIGAGQQEDELKGLAGPTIEFLGSRSREEVIDYLFKAKALIFPGVEDFGIVPLESLASGTPVIAYKAGGVLETLNDEVADFFTAPAEEGLLTAIHTFNSKRFSREALYEKAHNFSRERFKHQIENQIEKLLSL